MLAKPWISCLCAPTDLLKMSMSLSSNFHGIGDSPANVEFTGLLVNLHHFLAAFSIFGRAVLAEIAWDILGKLLLEYLQCHYGEVKNKIGGFQHYIVEWFMVLWYSYLFVVDFISLKMLMLTLVLSCFWTSEMFMKLWWLSNLGHRMFWSTCVTSLHCLRNYCSSKQHHST